MAASMLSSANVASVNRAAPAQASLASSFTGMPVSSFPATRKDFKTSRARGAVKVNCMQVWPPIGLKKFETLSYLPPPTVESLAKQIDYLTRNEWIPCIEFSVKDGFVSRENGRTPGYYDGRYWTMWKLPMFGCTESSQVLAEIEEAKKAYPSSFVRIIGFDNKRQVQCVSFIVHTPPTY